MLVPQPSVPLRLVLLVVAEGGAEGGPRDREDGRGVLEEEAESRSRQCRATPVVRNPSETRTTATQIMKEERQRAGPRPTLARRGNFDVPD